MPLLEEIKQNRDLILAIAARHGAKNVRVFGSVVRGEEGPDSDIDFLVGMEKGRSLLDFIAFQQDAEDLLKRKVDVIDEEGIYHLLKDRILNEAMPI